MGWFRKPINFTVRQKQDKENINKNKEDGARSKNYHC